MIYCLPKQVKNLRFHLTKDIIYVNNILYSMHNYIYHTYIYNVLYIYIHTYTTYIFAYNCIDFIYRSI